VGSGAARMRPRTPWMKPSTVTRMDRRLHSQGRWLQVEHLPERHGRLAPLRSRFSQHRRPANGLRHQREALTRVVYWFRNAEQQYMTIRSDSTSTIARAGHTGAGPSQSVARNIRTVVHDLRGRGKTVYLVWVQGHGGTPGKEMLRV
jgi:hypothetical protein